MTCEACVHFASREGACVHRYPNERHRAAAFDPGGLAEGTFCKEFELA
jgi:hypothetical protein